MGMLLFALATGASSALPACSQVRAGLLSPTWLTELLPSVVNISSTQVVREDRGPQAPQLPDRIRPFGDSFREFFNRNQGAPRRATSLGSGFIISSDGLVVTNNHVIEGRG